MQTKGRMYCLDEHKPVAAVRRGGFLDLPFRRWHCPDCGGKVEKRRSRHARRDRKKHAVA